MTQPPDTTTNELNRRFLECIQKRWDPEATEFVSATPYGTDWAGGTFDGFYGQFEITLRWLSGEEQKSKFVDGEDLETLWKAVVFCRGFGLFTKSDFRNVGAVETRQRGQ